MQADLKQARETMIIYLRLKLDEEDWHGVAAAAMVIRGIDAIANAAPKTIVTFVEPIAPKNFDDLNKSSYQQQETYHPPLIGYYDSGGNYHENRDKK